MTRIARVLRRYRTTLFLVILALVAGIAALQTARLRYLEQRHQAMFSEFGKARFEFQTHAGELARDAERCRTLPP